MNRLSASLLLITLFAGILSPAALAFSPSPPHACCLRKHHHHEDSAPDTSIRSRTFDQERDCCRSSGISQWAQPSPSISHTAELQQAAQIISHIFVVTAYVIGSPSVRAPPAAFLLA